LVRLLYDLRPTGRMSKQCVLTRKKLVVRTSAFGCEVPLDLLGRIHDERPAHVKPSLRSPPLPSPLRECCRLNPEKVRDPLCAHVPGHPAPPALLVGIASRARKRSSNCRMSMTSTRVVSVRRKAETNFGIVAITVRAKPASRATLRGPVTSGR